MTASPTSASIRYPTRTIQRADRAMRCSPFQLHLFSTMVQDSVSLKAIAHPAGLRNHYTTKPLAELTVENELMWLIQVGVLRREVDGQGLTDSFRVTPLGRQLVTKWQNLNPAKRHAPSWRERLHNALSRWLRFPF